MSDVEAVDDDSIMEINTTVEGDLTANEPIELPNGIVEAELPNGENSEENVEKENPEKENPEKENPEKENEEKEIAGKENVEEENVEEENVEKENAEKENDGDKEKENVEEANVEKENTEKENDGDKEKENDAYKEKENDGDKEKEIDEDKEKEKDGDIDLDKDDNTEKEKDDDKEKDKENREENENREKTPPPPPVPQIRAIRLVAIEKLMDPNLVPRKPERKPKRNSRANQSIVELSDSSESSEPPPKKKKKKNGIDYDLNSDSDVSFDSRKKSKKSSKPEPPRKTRESTRTLRGRSTRARNVTFKEEDDDDEEKSDRSASPVAKKRSCHTKPNNKKDLKEGHNLKDMNIKVPKLPNDLKILMETHKLEEILDPKCNPITLLSTVKLAKKTEKSASKNLNSKSSKTEASRVNKSANNVNSEDESSSICGEIVKNLPGKKNAKVDKDNIPAKNGSKKSSQSEEEDKPLAKLSGPSSSKPGPSKRGKKLVSDSEEEEKNSKRDKGDRSSKKKAKTDKRNKEDEGNSDDSDSIGNWKKMDRRSKRAEANKKKKLAVVESSDDENQNSEVENGSDDDEYDPSNGKRNRSSDSEYGKKVEDTKVQPKKKKSRIRRPKDSSSSNDDSDDEDDSDSYGVDADKPSAKRKRKKKKKGSDSDDDDDDDDDDDKDSPSKGRKNIRKLIGKGKLEEATKQAEREERERKERLAERQKLYNQVYDEKPEEIKELTSLVLDFNEETKEPLIEVDKKLVKKLKPHQANGVKFMWDACFETMKRIKKSPGAGCILAHCMGLGKTLQVVTLCHTLLNNPKTRVERILVVCPLSTVLNWVNEFKIWLKHCAKGKDIEIYEISKLKNNVFRANKLMEWHNEGGVMILGYDMFRNLANDSTKIKKKVRESLQTTLIDPGPDMIVCDEGHLLKNEKTALAKCINKVKTLRRIILTGTPIQNNMKEYYCMVQFVKPSLLGTYQEYMNRFVNPITNGQYTDSTQYDIQVMRRRAHVLHKLLDGCVQRRDYAVLAPFLPPKHEYVLSIKLTELQCQLYRFYMENIARGRSNDGIQRRASVLFNDFQNLQRIWTHPRVLRYNSDKYEEVQQKKRDLMSEDEEEGSLKDFIDDESDTSTSESGSESVSIASLDSRTSSKKKTKVPIQPVQAVQRRTRKNADQIIEETFHEPIQEKAENPTEWWMTMCPEENLDDITLSGKLSLLFKILKECENIGDKLLVFSQSLYSLDVIEHFLDLFDRNAQLDLDDQDIKLREFNASWSYGLDYFRLDGSTSIENRNINCKTFNDNDNHRARLYLISTRAGGLGINLFAANRVIIFDVSWNPSNDIQSIFRVYRFGQNKPCYIYRFVAMGTMEEKIYERQVTKQAISKRVIDEQQIDRHYNQNDLQELYRYDGINPEETRPIPALPKDRLFAEMLKICDDVIYKYHEHDSLLENKEEETLDEEERKAAWEEFETEKNRPPPTLNNFVSTGGLGQFGAGLSMKPNGPVTSNNVFGIRNDVLLRLLNLKVRQDNPVLNDTQIASRVPLLMQELVRQMKSNDNTLYNNLLQIFNQLQNPTYAPTGLMMGPFGMYPANYGMASAMSNLQNVSTAPDLSNLQPQNQQQQQQMNMLRYHQELTQRRYAEMAKANQAAAKPKIDPNAPIETIDLDD